MIIGEYKLTGKHGDYIVTKTVVAEKGNKKGEEYDSDGHYFGNLYQALTYLLDQKLNDADVQTVKEMKSLIHEFAIEIKDIADNCGKGEIK